MDIVLEKCPFFQTSFEIEATMLSHTHLHRHSTSSSRINILEVKKVSMLRIQTKKRINFMSIDDLSSIDVNSTKK